MAILPHFRLFDLSDPARYPDSQLPRVLSASQSLINFFAAGSRTEAGVKKYLVLRRR